MHAAAAAVLLLPILPLAAADHAIGHVMIPGGEIVHYVAELLAGSELWGVVDGALPDEFGDASCAMHTNASGYYTIVGVPVPREFEEGHLECHAAGQVLVTPDPFYDGDNEPDQR